MLDISTAGLDSAPSQPVWASRRLWSLWDIMINFNVYKLCTFLHMLEVTDHALSLQDGSINLSENDKAEYAAPLNFGEEQCKPFDLNATLNRIQRIRDHLGRDPITTAELQMDMRTLRETFIDDLKEVYCCHYPVKKADVYWAFMDQWKPILVNFPSALEAVAARSPWPSRPSLPNRGQKRTSPKGKRRGHGKLP